MFFGRKLKEKSFSGVITQICFGVFFAMLWLQAANPVRAQVVTATHIVSDSSPTTIKQTQDIATQSILQSTIAKTGLEAKLQDYIKYAKEAQHWIDQINKYSKMIENQARQFTSMRGILGVAEKELGLSNESLKALADLGTAIRTTFSLKTQFIGMIRSRLAMIEDLDRRARAGIFDPSADLNDLEDYLTQTMGRQAKARLQTRAKLAKQDPQLERLTKELEVIRASRTAAEAERNDINVKLGREASLQTLAPNVDVNDQGAAQVQTATGRQTLSVDAVNALIARLGQLDLLIAELTKQESELIDRIAKIYQNYQGSFDNIYFTGEQWQEAVDGWLAFSEAKNAEIGKMVDAYGNTDLADRPRVVATP